MIRRHRGRPGSPPARWPQSFFSAPPSRGSSPGCRRRRKETFVTPGASWSGRRGGAAIRDVETPRNGHRDSAFERDRAAMPRRAPSRARGGRVPAAPAGRAGRGAGAHRSICGTCTPSKPVSYAMEARERPLHSARSFCELASGASLASPTARSSGRRIGRATGPINETTLRSSPRCRSPVSDGARERRCEREVSIDKPVELGITWLPRG